MKKFVLSIFAVAAVAGVVFVSGVLSPEPADAFGTTCRCTQQFQTAVLTGHGMGSCAAAQADLSNKLHNAAGCDDFCSSSVVFTNACFNDEPNNPTWYKSKGYLVYQCEICIEKDLNM